MKLTEFVEAKMNENVKRAVEFVRLAMTGKLERFTNPNVIDATYSLSFHVQNGIIGHAKERDSEPAFVSSLARPGPCADDIVERAMRVAGVRLQNCLVPGWNGVLILSIAFFGGEATITSSVERTYKS